MRTVTVAVVAVLIGCAQAKPAPEPAVQPQAAKPPPPVTPPAPAEKPIEAARPVERAVAPASVYFDFDSSELTSSARSTLQAFSEALPKRPDVRVRVEGNCDERGTTEYNLALGQRRADAAKKYLQNLGVDGSRIAAISNGKEKPRATGHDEESWKENRRDDVLPAGETMGQVAR